MLLHPPLLRALGLDRKLRLGPVDLPGVPRAARACAGCAAPRSTRSATTRVRRLERGARRRVRRARRRRRSSCSSPTTAGDVVAIAELPDVVRGYEDIKLRNVERFREQAADLMVQLGVTDLVSFAAGDREPAIARAS